MSEPYSEEMTPARLLLKATMPVWLCVLIVAMTTGVTYNGWQRVRGRVVQSNEHHFSYAAVQVTEAPDWVPETIVNDVISNFNVGRPSQEKLIDHELLQELSAAFRAHPWVESVDGVYAVFPAKIFIDLTYRKPVGMVVLPSMKGVYAVDGQGVHLPSEYFKNSDVEIDHYIKILGIESMPMGNIGEKWGNPAVEQAAALAEHLSNDKAFLRIDSIRAESIGTNRRNMRQVFYLETSRDLKIRWGEMPLAENDTRKKRLIERASQYGSLEKSPTNADGIIDLQQVSF